MHSSDADRRWINLACNGNPLRDTGADGKSTLEPFAGYGIVMNDADGACAM